MMKDVNIHVFFKKISSHQLSSSPEEMTEVDAFNSSLASLISSGRLLYGRVFCFSFLNYVACNSVSYDQS